MPYSQFISIKSQILRSQLRISSTSPRLTREHLVAQMSLREAIHMSIEEEFWHKSSRMEWTLSFSALFSMRMRIYLPSSLIQNSPLECSTIVWTLFSKRHTPCRCRWTQRSLTTWRLRELSLKLDIICRDKLQLWTIGSAAMNKLKDRTLLL